MSFGVVFAKIFIQKRNTRKGGVKISQKLLKNF